MECRTLAIERVFRIYEGRTRSWTEHSHKHLYYYITLIFLYITLMFLNTRNAKKIDIKNQKFLSSHYCDTRNWYWSSSKIRLLCAPEICVMFLFEWKKIQTLRIILHKKYIDIFMESHIKSVLLFSAKIILYILKFK